MHAKQLGMHQSTIWNLLQKRKHAMSRRDDNISLAGFIELEEAIIGPRARKEGRPSSSKKSQKRPKRKSLGYR